MAADLGPENGNFFTGQGNRGVWTARRERAVRIPPPLNDMLCETVPAKRAMLHLAFDGEIVLQRAALNELEAFGEALDVLHAIEAKVSKRIA